MFELSDSCEEQLDHFYAHDPATYRQFDEALQDLEANSGSARMRRQQVRTESGQSYYVIWVDRRQGQEKVIFWRADGEHVFVRWLGLWADPLP